MKIEEDPTYLGLLADIAEDPLCWTTYHVMADYLDDAGHGKLSRQYLQVARRQGKNLDHALFCLVLGYRHLTKAMKLSTWLGTMVSPFAMAPRWPHYRGGDGYTNIMVTPSHGKFVTWTYHQASTITRQRFDASEMTWHATHEEATRHLMERQRRKLHEQATCEVTHRVGPVVLGFIVRWNEIEIRHGAANV